MSSQLEKVSLKTLQVFKIELLLMVLSCCSLSFSQSFQNTPYCCLLKNYWKSTCTDQTPFVVLLHGALKQAPKGKHGEETTICILIVVPWKCISK